MRARLARAEQTIQTCRHRMEVLLRISALALREQPLRVVLQEVVQEVSAWSGFPIVAIELYDEAHQQMEFAAASGMPLLADQAGYRVPVSQTLSGIVARSGQPLIERQAQGRAEYADAALRQLGVQTFVCMPLSAAEHVIGTLTLAHPAAVALDADLVPLALSLANVIAALIARRRAEERGIAAERQLREILDKLAAGVLLIDSDGGLRYANQRAAAIFGLTPAAVVGRSLVDLLPPTVAQQYLERNRQIIATQSFEEREEAFDLPVGRRTFFIADQVLTDAQGAGELLLSSSIDITARTRAEAELQVALTKYRTLFDGFPLGITVSDATGQIVETNAMAERLLGIGREAHERRKIDGTEWRIVRPDGTPMPAEEYASVRALAEQRVVENVEMGLVKPSGEATTWLNVTAAPLPLEDYGVVIAYGDITARKQAEEALRRSEQAFRALYEHMRDAFVSVDMHGSIRQYNRSFQELLGYDDEELARLTYEDITPARWHPMEARIVQEQIIPLGYSAVYEKEYRRKDGSIVPIELRTVLTHDEQGQRTGMWAIVRDITARRQTEARLQHLQAVTASFAAAQTLAQVRQVILDEIGGALGAEWVGVRLVTPLGLVADGEMRGLPHDAEVLRQAGPLSAATQHPIAEAARSGRPVFMCDRHELVQRYPDGAERMSLYRAQASAHLPLHRGDELFGVLTVAFAEPRPWDAGERAFALSLADRAAVAYERGRLFEAERRGRERSERLQAVTATLSRAATPAEVYAAVLHHGLGVMGGADADPALVADAGTFFVLAGEALTLASASGFEDPALAPYRSIPLDTPVPAANAVRTRRPVWLHSRADYIRQYPHLEAQVRQLPSEAAVSLPLLVEDRVLGVISFSFAQPLAFDAGEQSFLLTLADQAAQALERTRLFASLQEAVRLREQFLGIASHELRTPLTSVLGYAQLFQRRAARAGTLSERDQRSLQQIITSAERLNRMITTILDVSRIDQGRLQLERAPMELTALVRDTVAALQGTTHHEIVADAAGQPIWVNGDALRLEQVLHNLLGNAIKYSPQGGTVTVALTADADSVQIAVRDEGIGIPAADLPHIFERFYRAGNVGANMISGVGIGLFVVQEIITLHGGTVTVASEEDQGSSFTITLPRLAAPAASEERADDG